MTDVQPQDLENYTFKFFVTLVNLRQPPSSEAS